ncbi:MAG: hydrolase 1, exosortase A system-associated [Allosphingosinicella sp.]
MEPALRRLTHFSCDGEILAGTLDLAAGETGLLFVTGGSQTRVGSHRMYERLAKILAHRNIHCFRYDRRGVGDSSGEDLGFLASGPDLLAATDHFRKAVPTMREVFGFGLCDGASALALFGGQACLDGLIMVNPWLVEAETDAPPAAAIKDHYRRRLLSLTGWKQLLSGRIDFRKAVKGLARILEPVAETGLAADIAGALGKHRLKAQVILASADATAVAAASELGKARFEGRIAAIQRIASDSHTFARPGDEASLAGAVVEAVERLRSS